MQNAAIEMHWLMVNHISRLKKAEKPKMLVWRTEFGRGVFFLGKLNKPCGYWFCQKWLLIISKRPKKSSEWCYFNLTPPTDHGTILRRSPHEWISGKISRSSVQAKVWNWECCEFWVNLKSPQIAELSSNRNLIRPFRRDTVGFGGRQTPVREVLQILNCGKETWVADFSWIGFQYLDNMYGRRMCIIIYIYIHFVRHFIRPKS